MSSDQQDGGGGLMGIARTIVPDFIRRSFVIKFGLVLLVLGLSVGAVGFVGSQTLTAEFEDEVNEKFSNLASSQADALATWDTNNRDQVFAYSRHPDLAQENVSQLQADLLDERRARDTWGESGDTGVLMSVANTSSDTIIASTYFAYQDQSISSISQDTSEQIDSLGGPSDVRRTAPINGTQFDDNVYIAYVTPISGVDNRALIYHVPVATYTGSLSGGGAVSGEGSSGVALVVDGQNRILFEQQGARSTFMKQYDEATDFANDSREAGPANSTASVQGPAQGFLANGDYGLSGEEYVVGGANVQGSDWVVLIHTSTADAYGEVQGIADQALIATGLGVLLIILFGAALGRNTAKSIDRLTGKAEEMEEGNLEVDLSSGRIDNIGRLYDGFANMRDALNQQIQEAEQARKEAEVSRAEAMEMSTYLQETADEYAQIMQQCAAGDLTQRMEADGENEAMDRIASEFNEMIDELEKTTGQLKSFADEVETAGEVVQTSSESVRDASEQVADSVQKISDDAYDQKEQLQEISETMDQIADDLDTFAAENPEVEFGDSLERIEEIANMISEVVDLSEETMSEAENVAGAAEEQAAELNEVTQRAEDLSRYARPLREVLDRFETESEHEFYFPTGPGSGEGTMPGEDEE